MSLVNLAHVCSHLQNASLGRLGLTSIPYTKWHLSLALLLQKQGFLSQVKLGGPSPPASCFGQGPRDDHQVTNFPHESAGRDPLSPESALAKMIREGWSRHALKAGGFGEEAIAFAEEHGRKSLTELVAKGWRQQVARWLEDTRVYTEDIAEKYESDFQQNRRLCESPEEAAALEAEFGAMAVERRERVLEQFKANLPVGQAVTFDKYVDVPTDQLEQTAFELEDIEAIAGKEAYITEQDIRRNGLTIEAMGLQIPNQAVTLPMADRRGRTAAENQDPGMMETEGVLTQQNRASRRLWLGMKYYDSKPVLSRASMISKPTKRIWLNNSDIGNLVRGRRAGEVKPMTQIGEILAVSTDRGIMEARECAERRIGGMVLCRVW
ncbi:37S ribosomal S8, mitochondrial [Lecanosticta acicola]|uniref:37S ribosomal S8, mitochondrial n=1 Tax=Lecanosticta acicola TaxID=111012 RepID=A0AAI8Z3B4_9PEZI|nr:37S ribosomal S8, mitochondrial [Lecanosticta acicola]